MTSDTCKQSREEMEVLFTLLAERYERGSVFISSNLPFSKWEGVFKDPMTTAAAIDRPRSSLRHPRAQHPQLSSRTSQEGQRRSLVDQDSKPWK